MKFLSWYNYNIVISNLLYKLAKDFASCFVVEKIDLHINRNFCPFSMHRAIPRWKFASLLLRMHNRICEKVSTVFVLITSFLRRSGVIFFTPLNIQARHKLLPNLRANIIYLVKIHKTNSSCSKTHYALH